MSMRVLLTGSSGYLGRYLCAAGERAGLELITAGRSGCQVRLDLADADSIAAALAAVRPTAVLSCGALAQIGECARDPARAARINATAPALLASTGARIVQISTDLVFGGTRAPYPATATPDPRSVYGTTKAAGEAAAVAAGGLVVRLPLLFGRSHDGRRGATDMIRAAAPEGVTLYADEIRTPLHVADAARGLLALLSQRDRAGLVHLPGPERISRAALGRRFAALVALPPTAGPIREGPCPDPDRPRDVSLAGDWSCGRSLDAALAES